MSERNGEKSRYQINRKRGVHRRAKIREMLAAAAGEKRPATPSRGDRSKR